jgi:TRAP-type C4-dicarboxylate transport system permease small subunit
MPVSDDPKSEAAPGPHRGQGVTRSSLLERNMRLAAVVLALCGGGILILLAAITTVSILGRNLFDAPVRGDFELVEYGAGFAAALFLPLAQLDLVHPRITLFSDRWPDWLQRGLDAFGFFITLTLSLLLSIQLARGAWDALQFNDETMILRLPAWIGIAVVAFAFCLMALAAMALLVRAFRGAAVARSDQHI